MGAGSPLEHIEKLPVSQALIWLAAIKLGLHLVVNAVAAYGLFRDELYYVACANHLAFGYVDHPPLSILILSAQILVSGDSLFAIRFLPALAGALTVFGSGFIARELGGGRFAQILSAVSVLLVPAFLVINGFYSMNAYDLLLWTLVIYLLLRLMQSEREGLWLVFGTAIGLGIQNKLTMLFLGVGLVAGLLLSAHRRVFRERNAWFAALIAALIAAPYVIWQAVHGWPTLEFMANAQADIDSLSVPMYFLSQVFLLNPLFAIVWLPGLMWLLFSRRVQSTTWFSIPTSMTSTLGLESGRFGGRASGNNCW